MDLLLPSDACLIQELTVHRTSREKLSRNTSSVGILLILAHFIHPAPHLCIFIYLICSKWCHCAFCSPLQVKENLISVLNGSKCQTPRLAPPQPWAKSTTPLGPAPTWCLAYSRSSSALRHPALSRPPACVRLVYLYNLKCPYTHNLKGICNNSVAK